MPKINTPFRRERASSCSVILLLRVDDDSPKWVGKGNFQILNHFARRDIVTFRQCAISLCLLRMIRRTIMKTNTTNAILR